MAAASSTTSATGKTIPDFNEYDIQQLPNIIDVAGDIYYTGDEKPIQLGYKTRADMLKAFNINTANSSRKTDNLNKERLLRSYLYKGVNLDNIQFQGNDKDELIKILKERADDLKSSLSLNSYSFKQIIPERNYINLLKLIKELDEHEYKPGWSLSWDKAKDKTKEILKIGQNKKYARELVVKPDRIFEIILEMIWFLLHPDNVPEDVKKNWYAVIKGIDNLKTRDLIKAISTDPDISKEDNPLDYLTKVSIEDFIKQSDVNTALESVKDNIKENKTEKLIVRLKHILTLLQTKKYLSDESIAQIQNVTIDLDDAISANLNSSLISNPMATIGTQNGGAITPLSTLMIPFFNYFKEQYSLVYTTFENLINNTDTANISYKLTDVLLLLHIIRNVNTNNLSKDKHGVYRIDNIPNSLGVLLTYLIKGINENTDIDKEVFNDLSERIPNTYNQTGKNFDLKIKLGFFTTNSFEKLADNEIQDLIDKKGLGGITVDAFKKDIDTFFTSELDSENKINKTYLCISSNEDNIPYKLNTLDMSTQDINNDNITTVKIDPKSSILLPHNTNISFNEVVQYRPNNNFILNDGHLIIIVLCILKKLMPTK